MPLQLNPLGTILNHKLMKIGYNVGIFKPVFKKLFKNRSMHFLANKNKRFSLWVTCSLPPQKGTFFFFDILIRSDQSVSEVHGTHK